LARLGLVLAACFALTLLIIAQHPLPPSKLDSAAGSRLQPASWVDPLASGVEPPKPTGLASYGVLNSSGLLDGYTVRSDMLLGTLNLSSIAAYYPKAETYNVSEYGASLQLNAMLVASSANTSWVYWVQNVVVFLTNNQTMFYADNVWNVSGAGAKLSNSSITSDSGGYVVNTSRGYVYGSSSANLSYALPLSLRLIMAERVVYGVGVEVGMGAQLLRNGSEAVGGVLWYDNATIHDGSVRQAYFDVEGDSLTPQLSDGSALYYDAELVFGGEANGAPTNFTELNATLGLFYRGEGGALTPFPSYYSFGADTAESAYDLHVRYLGGGLAELGVGVPDYRYLGAANTSAAATTQTQTVQLGGTMVEYSTNTSTSNGSSQSSVAPSSMVLEFNVAGAAVLVVVVLLFSVLVGRSRARPAVNHTAP